MKKFRPGAFGATNLLNDEANCAHAKNPLQNLGDTGDAFLNSGIIS